MIRVRRSQRRRCGGLNCGKSNDDDRFRIVEGRRCIEPQVEALSLGKRNGGNVLVLCRVESAHNVDQIDNSPDIGAVRAAATYRGIAGSIDELLRLAVCQTGYDRLAMPIVEQHLGSGLGEASVLLLDRAIETVFVGPQIQGSGDKVGVLEQRLGVRGRNLAHLCKIFFDPGLFKTGFGQILRDSGVSKAIVAVATDAHLSPLLLGWVVAVLIRIATGSATVAMTTACGIVAPIAAASGAAVKPELMVLATGAGSLILSHVNDGGFWLVKEYFNLTVPQTFKTWTVLETIISIVALLLTLALATVV